VFIALPPISSEPPLLTVLVGLDAGQVFSLDRRETLIGRGRDADLRIEDPGTSRKHARIVRTEAERYVFEDLRSTNGIFVNGRRGERFELADGDRLQLGPGLVFQFALAHQGLDEAEPRGRNRVC
jgi:pSer/pThr/pTyr-binding forkhead associated (FHA) protein